MSTEYRIKESKSKRNEISFHLIWEKCTPFPPFCQLVAADPAAVPRLECLITFSSSKEIVLQSASILWRGMSKRERENVSLYPLNIQQLLGPGGVCPPPVGGPPPPGLVAAPPTPPASPPPALPLWAVPGGVLFCSL